MAQNAIISERVFTRPELEAMIREAPFHIKGAALGKVREGGLFKTTHTSFAAYCKDTFGFTEDRATQLISAANVVLALKNQPTMPALLPASEAETRPLSGFSPERLCLIWDYILLHAPGGQLTARYIEAVANQARSLADDEPIQFLTVEDVPDTKFPSDNPFEIPTLNLARQATAVHLPLEVWGGQKRHGIMRGTWHMYTEDERFLSLWDDPTVLVNTRCKAVVEPNFSVYDNTPRIVSLYRIYLKRYLAVFWQSCGIAVLVDLNVSAERADDNLIGVPAGWRAYATRGYAERLNDTEREYELACQRAGSRDVLFVVYGGGKAVQERAKQRGWHWYPEHMDKARNG